MWLFHHMSRMYINAFYSNSLLSHLLSSICIFRSCSKHIAVTGCKYSVINNLYIRIHQYCATCFDLVLIVTITQPLNRTCTSLHWFPETSCSWYMRGGRNRISVPGINKGSYNHYFSMRHCVQASDALSPKRSDSYSTAAYQSELPRTSRPQSDIGS